jgi:hypothetical protein
MDWYEVVGIVLGVLSLDWLAAIPREVRVHNRQVANQDEDLGYWIADTDGELVAEEAKVKSRDASRSKSQWPMYLRVSERQQVRDQVVRRFEDQLRGARRYRGDVAAAEGMGHKLWRRMPWSGPLPELTALQAFAGKIKTWKTKITEDDIRSGERFSESIRQLARKFTGRRQGS